jgi:hypothetical protein
LYFLLSLFTSIGELKEDKSMLDSPSKLKRGPPEGFQASILFPVYVSKEYNVHNVKEGKAFLQPINSTEEASLASLLEIDILSPLTCAGTVFYSFDPSKYKVSTDSKELNTARKSLQKDLKLAGCMAGCKYCFEKVDQWGGSNHQHWKYCYLKCSSSAVKVVNQADLNKVVKRHSTNNTRQLHSVPNGNVGRERKSGRIVYFLLLLLYSYCRNNHSSSYLILYCFRHCKANCCYYSR